MNIVQTQLWLVLLAAWFGISHSNVTLEFAAGILTKHNDLQISTILLSPGCTRNKICTDLAEEVEHSNTLTVYLQWFQNGRDLGDLLERPNNLLVVDNGDTLDLVQKGYRNHGFI